MDSRLRGNDKRQQTLVNTEDYFQTAAIVKEGKLEIKDHLYPTKERISRHFKKEDDSK